MISTPSDPQPTRSLEQIFILLQDLGFDSDITSFVETRIHLHGHDQQCFICDRSFEPDETFDVFEMVHPDWDLIYVCRTPEICDYRMSVRT